MILHVGSTANQFHLCPVVYMLATLGFESKNWQLSTKKLHINEFLLLESSACVVFPPPN